MITKCSLLIKLQLTIILLLSLSANCLSQSSADNSAKTHLALSFQPLFLLNNAIRFDAELSRNKQPFAVIVGAEIYSGSIETLYAKEDNFGEATADKMSGVGINLAFKYNVLTEKKMGSLYLSPGITFRRLKLTTNGQEFYPYTENGIEYFTYGTFEQKYKLNPFLMYANFGYKSDESEWFIFDAYLGMGYKIVNRIPELEAKRDYEKPLYGFNHNGFLVQFGIKFGFQLR